MSRTPIISFAEWKRALSPKKPHAKARQLEHAEQVVFVSWMRARKHFLFAVPNAGKRSPALMAYLKAEGFESGVPDVIIVTPPPLVPECNWAVEMKQRNGVPSDVTDKQKAMHEQFRRDGWIVDVCFGAAQAISAAEKLGY